MVPATLLPARSPVPDVGTKVAAVSGLYDLQGEDAALRASAA
jgi:hypothetical protein